MSSTVSPVLELPLIQPSQSQKHVTHNEALKLLDVLVHLSLSSRTTTTPPANPVEGQRHLVPDGATGDWTGQTDKLAVWYGGAWEFINPQAGWQGYVQDENIFIIFTTGGWVSRSIQEVHQNLDMVGVNTTADLTNRLAVTADATLLSHDGDDHRLKINKATTADTASLLFQTGFDGHAEMGLAGTDDFGIRVSPDGNNWTTAITIDETTGQPTLPEGLSVDGTLTGSAVVGVVSQTGGTSTGAIIEQGTNASGAFTKFANGLMIMTSAGLTVPNVSLTAGNIYMSSPGTWTFPAAPIGSSQHIVVSSKDTRVWGVPGAPNGTQCSIRLMSYSNSLSTTQTVQAISICRWF